MSTDIEKIRKELEVFKAREPYVINLCKLVLSNPHTRPAQVKREREIYEIAASITKMMDSTGLQHGDS